MKYPIAISLSPNTSPQDVKTAFQVLLTPVTWQNLNVQGEAANHISHRLGGRFVALTSSGRQALYDILRAYGIGRGDEVIIQAFTCIAVPEPILWAGATPVYADIEADTYNLDIRSVKENISAHTKAIIVQHTFGIPGPIQEILEIARKRNIVVIEDCAHSFGAKVSGRSIGTFGDAAILSFGRDKMLSSVFGGAAVFSDRKHLETVQRMAKERPYPPTGWIAQQLLHPILFALALPTYFSGIGKVIIAIGQHLHLLSKAVTPNERRGKRPNHIEWRYSPALARLLLKQLGFFSANVRRRQAIAERYHAQLDRTSVVLPEPSRFANPAWLRFPIQVKDRDELLAAAREKKMVLGDWYDAPLVPSDCSLHAFGYTAGMCPVAEQVARHVVNLPTYPRMTDTQVAAVVDLVKSYGS